MSKFSVLVILVLMIASFQNCGKVQKADISSSSPSTNTQYNKFSVEEYKVLSLWDYKRMQYLDVDLRTGEIKVFEEAGQASGPTYQLKSEELAVAQATLASAQICEPVVRVETGEVCSMSYRYPYAILVDKGDEVRLGEMNTGCDIPIDLCDDKGAQLKSWSSHIVEHLLDGSVTQ